MTDIKDLVWDKRWAEAWAIGTIISVEIGSQALEDVVPSMVDNMRIVIYGEILDLVVKAERIDQR